MNEAKVLTLYEALELKPGDEICLEYGGGHTKMFMLTVLKNRQYGLSFHRHLSCPWNCYGVWPVNKNGWGWRLWTAKPTEEQMANTPWKAE